MKRRLVVIAPLFHRIQDRTHGFPEVAQRVFHAGRHFRVDGPRDQSILFHGAHH